MTKNYHFAILLLRMLQWHSSLFTGEKGHLKWEDDWISFLDTLLQMTILGSNDRSLRLPTRISSVRIDPSCHLDSVTQNENEVPYGEP